MIGAQASRASVRTLVAIVVLLVTAMFPLPRQAPAVAAASGGTLYGWGYNHGSELGYRPSKIRRAGVKVRLPVGVRVKAFGAGEGFGLALGSNGAVHAWGDNKSGQLGIGFVKGVGCQCFSSAVGVHFPSGVRVRAISAGWDHSLALSSGGAVYAWGASPSGQAGKVTDESCTCVRTPAQVSLPGGVKAKGIAAGWGHSLALGADGHVYAWGFNNHGQLGNGSQGPSETTDVPVRVLLPAGLKIAAVSAGEYHSLALASDGAVYAWGLNDSGQIGNGGTGDVDTPVQVHLPGRAKVRAIAAGDSYSLALAKDGSVYVWGTYYEREASPDIATHRMPARVHLPGGVRATAISAGEDYSLICGSDGAMYAWGDNNGGELGDGTTSYRDQPVRVHLPGGVAARVIAAGENHSLALGSDGMLYSWGKNSFSDLGAGEVVSSYQPIPVPSLAGARVTAIGKDMALLANGTIHVWGATAAHMQFPKGVRIAAIAGGAVNGLAVTTGGGVFTWGTNYSGQLGNGSMVSRSRVPVRVRLPAGVTVRAVVPGDGFTLALARDGAVYAWGNDLYGQLGNGGTQTRSVPVRVRLPAGVKITSISVGRWVQALSTQGDLYLWGYDPGLVLPVENAKTTSCSGGGSATDACILTPVRVRLPGGVRATAIAQSFWFSMALGADGAVYSWGANDAGELGTGGTESHRGVARVDIPAGVRVTGITAAPLNGMAIASNGAAYGWGANSTGQLGIGTATTTGCTCVPGPALIKLPAGVRIGSIVTTGGESVAIDPAGAAYAWGGNVDGQLGIGHITRNTCACLATPARVHLPSGLHVAAVTLGPSHTLAITTSDEAELPQHRRGVVVGPGFDDLPKGQAVDGGGLTVARNMLPARMHGAGPEW